jgi:hypothetical protein
VRIPDDDRSGRRFDEVGEAGGREAVLECSERRSGEDDVSDLPEANQQNLHE